MEDVVIKFEEDCITVIYGNRRILLNSNTYTPDAAIYYALNEFGITKFSEDRIKTNLETLEYYEDKVSNLNSLLNTSLDLVSKLIKDNNSLRNKIMANSYGRK